MSDIPRTNASAPKTAVEDRYYLGLTIPEYQNFAQAVGNKCFLDKEGNHCKLKNATTKKLKNIRYGINKSQYLLKSLIWKEQLRIVEFELQKRRGIRNEHP